MRINTTRFGRIDVDTADVIHFASGLPGLEDCRDWALLADATNDALGWLQSTTRGDVALAVVSPRRFVPDYQVRIPRSELTPLAIGDIRQAQVVVVVGTNGTTLTLNLKAPIVINLEARTGRQVVASGELPLQYELNHERPPLKKSA
ncbi:MAG: flagellar assembly protein FliW [Planctomycetaceae bacterium]|jgi:flagellar assembly factor FliW|nr:flagellar assembly protein FliW [Planctomycetaceae bacterium]